MYEENIANIVMTTKQLLDEKGVFYPVDLLIQQGYLSLHEYVAWEGERDRDYLERKMDIPFNLFSLSEMLQLGCESAKISGGLCIEFERIEVGKPPTRDSEARKSFGMLFFKSQQSDFHSNTLLLANSLCEKVIDSLISDSVEKTHSLWIKIQDFIPEWYPWRFEIEELLAAKGSHIRSIKEIEDIETHLVPIARKVFGSNVHRFMGPVWRKAKAFIEEEHDWRSDSLHLLYHVIACWHIGEHRAFQTELCELFWNKPEFSEHAIQEHRFPDERLYELWGSFIEKELRPIDFPSYITIKRYLRSVDISDKSSAPKSFISTLELLSNPKDGSIREKLKTENPKLLDVFLNP